MLYYKKLSVTLRASINSSPLVLPYLLEHLLHLVAKPSIGVKVHLLLGASGKPPLLAHRVKSRPKTAWAKSGISSRRLGAYCRINFRPPVSPFATPRHTATIADTQRANRLLPFPQSLARLDDLTKPSILFEFSKRCGRKKVLTS